MGILLIPLRIVLEVVFMWTGEVILFILNLGRHKPKWGFEAQESPALSRLFFEISVLIGLSFLFLIACDSGRLRMASVAMEPTIMKGDMVNVDYRAFRQQSPKRWDIIVYERDKKRYLAHRVVGLPGEKIRIDNGEIFVNERRLKTPKSVQYISYIPKEMLVNSAAEPPFEIYDVPKDSYFVLGDNSGKSFDSRFIGSIPKKKIKGRVVL